MYFYSLFLQQKYNLVIYGPQRRVFSGLEQW